MDNADSLQNFDFDPRNAQYQYSSRLSWPIQHNPPMSQPSPTMVFKRSTSPLPLPINTQSLHQTTNLQQSAALMREWQLPAQTTATTFTLDTTTYPPQQFDPYGVSFQTSPTDYLPPHTSLEASMDANLGAGLQMDGSYLGLQGDMNQLPFSWQDLGNELMGYAPSNGLSDMTSAQQPFFAGSPSEGYLSENLEIRSLRSSSSDNGWTTVDHALPHTATLFNAEQALHPRSFSDSSFSDIEHNCNRNSWDGFVDIPANAINSPSTNSASDLDFYASDHSHYYDTERHSPITVSTALVKPIAIRQPQPISPQRSSPTSPQKSKQTRKTPIMKSSKAIARRTSQNGKNDTEKRVGRRKGPLRPEQRKQAGEIRKLGACLRCRFLKKVCDAGEPCAGCQPSHARLWQVPCTRIDIKDIAYFMKDWKADYERHVSLGFSVGNIKGFSDQERTLFITHGYGHYLPVQAREVYVRDERCFGVDWVESSQFECGVNTAKLSAGMEGISTAMLSNYLDRHIDGGFEKFVDDYFEGTPFITQIFKTAYRFWVREKTPVIRKALKLVLAYNLTQHVTMVHGIGSEEDFEGKVDVANSKWNGQIVAPVMINFQVKCAMADMWRELQKDILEELSTLYSSVYTRDKLKHWPTIFMLASILLAVWEEMQFDCRFRVPDAAVVEKFCNDMETTPVGVIVGLFGAISQKLPAFSEWDTRKHAHLLNSNQAVCDAMEEVRDHVTRHDKYLRTRAQATFDRNDFDSLSNKFVSKLVIKAN